jgi:thioredoxin-like negative regulator of GroEL
MQNYEDIQKLIQQTPALFLYFSSPTCNVCHALKPKLFLALKENFEKIEILCIDVSKEVEIAAQFSVFSLPTVIFFLDGKEFLRKSRNMSVQEVIQEIQRPYSILFS